LIKTKPNIGIVGGGIGGVAAAVALRQVGIDAVVYERSAQLGEVGAGMMLWPNATRVLQRMGHMRTFLTCEAGVSLKPGASAPGTRRFSIKSPRMRAKAEMIRELPPVITGYEA
jgi:2-polyprenyl-6-methoxyphenol hydroxylase-like FAD-dependent oxidoreductase